MGDIGMIKGGCLPGCSADEKGSPEGVVVVVLRFYAVSGLPEKKQMRGETNK